MAPSALRCSLSLFLFEDFLFMGVFISHSNLNSKYHVTNAIGIVAVGIGLFGISVEQNLVEPLLDFHKTVYFQLGNG